MPDLPFDYSEYYDPNNDSDESGLTLMPGQEDREFIKNYKEERGPGQTWNQAFAKKAGAVVGHASGNIDKRSLQIDKMSGALPMNSRSKAANKMTIKQLRDFIQSEIKSFREQKEEQDDLEDDIDEASTTANIQGYNAPLGTSGDDMRKFGKRKTNQSKPYGEKEFAIDLMKELKSRCIPNDEIIQIISEGFFGNILRKMSGSGKAIAKDVASGFSAMKKNLSKGNDAFYKSLSKTIADVGKDIADDPQMSAINSYKTSVQFLKQASQIIDLMTKVVGSSAGPFDDMVAIIDQLSIWEKTFGITEAKSDVVKGSLVAELKTWSSMITEKCNSIIDAAAEVENLISGGKKEEEEEIEKRVKKEAPEAVKAAEKEEIVPTSATEDQEKEKKEETKEEIEGEKQVDLGDFKPIEYSAFEKAYDKIVEFRDNDAAILDFNYLMKSMKFISRKSKEQIELLAERDKETNDFVINIGGDKEDRWDAGGIIERTLDIYIQNGKEGIINQFVKKEYDENTKPFDESEAVAVGAEAEAESPAAEESLGLEIDSEYLADIYMKFADDPDKLNRIFNAMYVINADGEEVELSSNVENGKIKINGIEHDINDIIQLIENGEMEIHVSDAVKDDLDKVLEKNQEPEAGQEEEVPTEVVEPPQETAALPQKEPAKSKKKAREAPAAPEETSEVKLIKLKMDKILDHRKNGNLTDDVLKKMIQSSVAKDDSGKEYKFKVLTQGPDIGKIRINQGKKSYDLEQLFEYFKDNNLKAYIPEDVKKEVDKEIRAEIKRKTEAAAEQ